MPMDVMVIVQDITVIVTKNIISTAVTIIRNTMVGITDKENTMIGIIRMKNITVGAAIINTMVGIIDMVMLFHIGIILD